MLLASQRLLDGGSRNLLPVRGGGDFGVINLEAGALQIYTIAIGFLRLDAMLIVQAAKKDKTFERFPTRATTYK